MKLGITSVSVYGCNSRNFNSRLHFLTSSIFTIGLGHSNQGGAYKDMSGMMGYSYLGDGRPIMCFNTAKNWELGWYEDKHEIVNPLNTNFWEGDLIGYSDYQNSASPEGSSIILKIEGHNKNYFVGFNRKAGINSQNQQSDAMNKVTVHSVGTTTTSVSSELEAKLSIGESFVIPFFGDTDHSVLVQVENIDMSVDLAFARVSVTYMQCTSDTDCDDGSSCTTNTCNLSTGTCIHAPNDHCSGFMEMILLTDNFPAETSWTIIDNCKNDEVVLSGGFYKNKFATYTDSANVPPSQYTLKIQDTYGDGICCGQGSGSFHVKFADETVAIGGKFGKSEEHTWGSCEAASPTVSPAASLTVSPTASPTVSPTASPTTCEMTYELTFKAAALTSWEFAYGENVSLVSHYSSEVYQPGSTYTESGCLKSNCYHFVIKDAESYSLVFDGAEFASGEQIEDPEVSLYGTCRPIES